MANDTYNSRKFNIGVASLFGIHTALFTAHISGSEYIAGLGLIIGLYGAANVGDKYANR